MSYPTVDIVSLSYRDIDRFPAFIESVGKLDYPAEKLKLIIVDNGSTDGSIALLKKLLPTLPFEGKLIEVGENLGFGGGCNRGAFDGESDYILLLNADNEVDADSLKHLIRYAVSDPKIGQVEPLIYPYDVPKFIEKETNNVDWCRGGTVLIKREAFLSVNGFDTFFYPIYCEDVDLSWRLWLNNWRCVKINEAKVKVEDVSPDGTIKPTETLYSVQYSFAMRFIYGTFKDFFSHIFRGFRYVVSPKVESNIKKGIIKGFIMILQRFPSLMKRRISAQKAMRESNESKRFVFTEWYYGRWNN